MLARIKTVLQDLAIDDTGGTTMEYGLVAALMSIVIVSALGSIATKLKTEYTTLSSAL
jgi:Flp pilus assembly pilin Flp